MRSFTETRGGGASFWDAFQAGEIIGRGISFDGKEGVDVGTIHGWSAADLQCDLAGYLARLPEETYRTFYSDSATTLEDLIHTFFNPSSEEQSQQQPDWVLQMVAQRRMIRLRVFTDAASGDWSVKDYPEDAAMGGLPWVALIFSECNKTWQTL
jgi:hypothetical protein